MRDIAKSVAARLAPSAVRRTAHFYWIVLRHAWRDTFGLANRQGLLVGALVSIIAGFISAQNAAHPRGVDLGAVVLPSVEAALIFCGAWFMLQLVAAPARIFAEQSERLAVLDAPPQTNVRVVYERRGGEAVMTFELAYVGQRPLDGVLLNFVLPISVARFDICSQHGVPAVTPLNAELQEGATDRRWTFTDVRCVPNTRRLSHFIVEYDADLAGQDGQVYIVHHELPGGGRLHSFQLPDPALPAENASPYGI